MSGCHLRLAYKYAQVIAKRAIDIAHEEDPVEMEATLCIFGRLAAMEDAVTATRVMEKYGVWIL